ncbi:ATP-binding protein [Desulfosporosinus hippei]|uniref:histidine kinase n=1 Tax=Desulfosporosinus hippei DSM 8344 TaxID=1121419 RepID=A0A1G7W9B4_9FIRM|nr:ATP-binding protein [Desulfosporosinus hippei]SDG68585.1 two-component system, OmpR family, sensor kinase [Desulfosporosinus hippei DSM 8344]
MERRVRGNPHARCGAGEKVEMTSKLYLLLSLSINHDEAFFRIDVQDEGKGIPPEYLERIFEEFRQVDSAYTRKVGGTGLGLSITKKFVEMLGGEIKVQSTLGAGSIFTVFLPFRYTKKC